jgi:hypothetical protein
MKQSINYNPKEFIVHAPAISVRYKGINYNSKNFIMHIHGLVLWNRVLITTLKSFIVHAPAIWVLYKLQV